MINIDHTTERRLVMEETRKAWFSIVRADAKISEVFLPGVAMQLQDE